MTINRALVTGGAGFVGSHLVDALLAQGSEVVVLDDFSNGKYGNLPTNSRLNIIQSDILNIEALKMALDGVDTVFHEAAVVEVMNPNDVLMFSVNVEGSKFLLHYSREFGVKNLVLASSAAVYGRGEINPRRESQDPLPTSGYGKSKLDMERAAFDIVAGSNMKISVLRNFNIYGLRATNKRYSGVINVFANNILNDQECVIYGDGQQSRDFTHVSDIIQANLLVVEKQKTLFEIYNVGTGQDITVNQLVNMEADIFGRKVKIRHAGARGGEVYKSQADITKISKLGYVPKVKFRDGLEDYLHRQYIRKPTAAAA
jgi:UDP-glucose 4-epimerase